jgi:hypothetical protein
MNANEILGEFDRAREAHPKQHTRTYPGGARQIRQRFGRGGMADSPISPYKVRGCFRIMILRADGQNIGR